MHEAHCIFCVHGIFNVRPQHAILKNQNSFFLKLQEKVDAYEFSLHLYLQHIFYFLYFLVFMFSAANIGEN